MSIISALCSLQKLLQVVPNCVPLFVSPYESVDELLAETDDELAEVWKQPEVQQRISEIWQLHAKVTTEQPTYADACGSVFLRLIGVLVVVQ